jgi:hypothetical protein
VAAGIAVAVGIRAIARRDLPSAGVIVAGAAIYLVALPRLAHADRHTLLAEPAPAETQLASFLDAHSRSSDFVLAYDLRAADLAHRLVPPPLCDPSDVRRLAGYLTTSDLIKATTQYQPRLVVASPGIYAEYPRYVAWLKRMYKRIPGPPGTDTYARR